MVTASSKKTTTHRGRDYVADQLGFYTLLDDGFGMETLAYCHDLWELSEDPHSLQGRHLSVMLNRIIELITQAGGAVHKALFQRWAMFRERVGRAWDTLWSRRKDQDGQDDSLDWLYSEQ
ncbi:hypothetical protein EDD11_003524 [Mortierella claussenii]|nr:hypothetical protein EDD11_003524 [Mortierella claussenii]